MVLPRPIYEGLPVIYLLIAMVVSTLIQSGLAFFSAAILSFAAVLVVMMRVQYRRHREAELRGITLNARIEKRRRDTK
ncbi:MAG: hypothetical protein HOM11_13220 [Methylococcales bacterium]|jgi:hypothetical protein|nr:hypothetical protein [Methylococcales bacterium]MBT7443983.1 hypothetical protein [Methylococcales bacterium]